MASESPETARLSPTTMTGTPEGRPSDMESGISLMGEVGRRCGRTGRLRRGVSLTGSSAVTAGVSAVTAGVSGVAVSGSEACAYTPNDPANANRSAMTGAAME